MRLLYFAGAALLALYPTVSAAQGTSGSGTTGGTTTTTTTGGTTTGGDQGTQGAGWMGGESNWIGSAFIGSNFAQDADDASLDFGGSIGYLWRGAIGAEFQANFSPDFELEPGRNALLLGEQPWINSYMVNAIAAIPIGSETRFQPYVSAGVGALTLRSAVLQGDGGNGSGTLDDFEPDSTRMGANFGAGLVAFGGNVGVRGDVRYFTGFDQDANLDNDDSPGTAIGNAVLSDLSFWRANIGIAFRW